MGEVLRVEDLHVHFPVRDGVIKAVNGVSFSLDQGSIMALVGESGAGKSVTALAILGLVPFPGKVVQGKVLFNGHDMLALDDAQLRKVRGKDISMIFQDAQSSLNPVMTVGNQIQEMLLNHTGMSKKEARALGEELLRQVGLPDPKRIMGSYPFQLSGGMCQRVMIAMAVALKPKVIIADEPTSNLDVTLQAEILWRLKSITKDLGTAILLITHDMGVVARVADRVTVMYGGRAMEQAALRDLFRRPLHPYTWGLLQAVPRLDEAGARLRPLAGSPPHLFQDSTLCPFLPRCPKAVNTCRLEPAPALSELEPGHLAACYNHVRHD